MNENEKDLYGEVVGCDEIHYSLLKSDTKEKYEADTPKYLAPVAEITMEDGSTPNKRFYDNVARYVDLVENDGNVSIIVSGIPCAIAAILTGKHYDAATGRLYDTGTVVETPWATLSGRMSLAGKHYRYFQFLKGKFAVGNTTAKTKEGGNITPNTTELIFVPVTTIHAFQLDEKTVAGTKSVKADTTDSAFTDAASWFSKVQTPPEVAAAAAEEGAQSEEE